MNPPAGPGNRALRGQPIRAMPGRSRTSQGAGPRQEACRAGVRVQCAEKSLGGARGSLDFAPGSRPEEMASTLRKVAPELDLVGPMHRSFRTCLCLLLALGSTLALGVPAAHAGDAQAPGRVSAGRRAADTLPISGPRTIQRAPRATAIPVAAAVPPPPPRVQAPKEAPTASRWPTRARPFVPSQVIPGQRRAARVASAPVARTRSTYRAPSRVATQTNSGLRRPEVRRSSPSYAELERSRPSQVLSRVRADVPSRAGRRAATRNPAARSTARGTSTRRTTSRRTPTRRTPTRFTASPRRPAASPSLSVPLAPGQAARPVPTRRRLNLRPPPGCTEFG